MNYGLLLLLRCAAITLNTKLTIRIRESPIDLLNNFCTGKTHDVRSHTRESPVHKRNKPTKIDKVQVHAAVLAIDRCGVHLEKVTLNNQCEKWKLMKNRVLQTSTFLLCIAKCPFIHTHTLTDCIDNIY